MNRPYSEATLNLVAQAMDVGATRGKQHDPSRCLSCRSHATLVLDVLAEAGLLLPEGVETRTEWQVKFISEGGSHVVGEMRQQEAHAHASHHGRMPGCRAEVHKVTSYVVDEVEASYPQRPDAVRLAVGDNKPSQDRNEEN